MTTTDPTPDTERRDVGPSVQIELTVMVELVADEVWPDGEPDTWGADEVLAEILKSGTLRQLDSDWDILGDGTEVRVDVGTTSARGDLA